MSRDVLVLGFQDIKKHKVTHLINTTSKSTNWSKGLSPFFLGPVVLYNGFIAQNVENAWQFSKVYKNHVDEFGEPTTDYFEWAEKGWKDKYAHRYPMGKGSVPLYSYWAGQKLGYIDARKKIYAPLYARSVVNTEEFSTLLDIYESDDSFALVDFDGYDYLSMNMSLQDVMNEPKMKMGHAFVLAMLLKSPELRSKFGYRK